jgi:CelD/BcsL family acetyltransferase involved in cellulose biosynthesis
MISYIEKTHSKYVLDLPKTTNELNIKLGKKFIKNLRYYERILNTKPSYSHEILNKKNWEKFIQLHLSSMHSKKEFSPFELSGFRNKTFEDVLKHNGGFFTLNVDGKIVVMILYKDVLDIRYYMNVGIDTDYKKYSIGNLLIYHTIKDAISSGLKYFNFGEGDQSYKTKTWKCHEVIQNRTKIYPNKFYMFIDIIYTKILHIIKRVLRIRLLRGLKRTILLTKEKIKNA